MDKVEKWKRLDALTAQDERYNHYRRSYGEYAMQFAKIIRWCPPKIRNILNGYADSGRLMMQRAASIALDHTEFIDE